MEIYYIHI